MTGTISGEKYIHRHIINWYDIFEAKIPVYVSKLKIFKASSYPSKSLLEEKNVCVGNSV